MSTRCQIGIYPNDKTPLNEPEILIYRHSDGYPEGVIPDVVPFLKDFNSKRGLMDTEYSAAWLVYHLIDLHVKQMLKIREELPKDTHIPEDGRNYLGYGICGDKVLHGDIEYFYRITSTALYVYSVSDGKYENMKLEDTVDLKTKEEGVINKLREKRRLILWEDINTISTKP